MKGLQKSVRQRRSLAPTELVLSVKLRCDPNAGLSGEAIRRARAGLLTILTTSLNLGHDRRMMLSEPRSHDFLDVDCIRHHSGYMLLSTSTRDPP
jgi:hypothetical protein